MLRFQPIAVFGLQCVEEGIGQCINYLLLKFIPEYDQPHYFQSPLPPIEAYAIVHVSHQWCDLFYRLLHSYTRHIEGVVGGERDILLSAQE